MIIRGNEDDIFDGPADGAPVRDDLDEIVPRRRTPAWDPGARAPHDRRGTTERSDASPVVSISVPLENSRLNDRKHGNFTRESVTDAIESCTRPRPERRHSETDGIPPKTRAQPAFLVATLFLTVFTFVARIPRSR
jgi:hypothetical protein